MSYEDCQIEALTMPKAIRRVVDLAQADPRPPEPVDAKGGFPRADFEGNAENAFRRFKETSKTAEIPGLDSETRVSMDSDNVWSGFLAIGRIIGLSVPAYVEHCTEEAKEPIASEIVDVLNRQKSFQNTALFLANMPNSQNRVWEICLGVRDYTYAIGLAGGNYGINSFTVKLDPEIEALVLDISPEVASFIRQDPEYRMALEESSGGTCPTIAHGSLERVWRMQVASAQQNGLFGIALGAESKSV